MRTAIAALLTAVALGCSGKEAREEAAPPPSSTPVAAARPADAAPPPAADAAPALEPELGITLTADGKTLVGGKEIAAADLEKELEKAKAARASALVINADRNVLHKRVVEVMETAKKVGFEKMKINTGAPP